MQHFSQYYFSKDDQHKAHEAKPVVETVRQAVDLIEACFSACIDNALEKNQEDRMGVLLSGGVDSSLLVAMLRKRTNKEIVCFTALSENDDPDVLPSKQIAHIFNVKWVKCRVRKQDLAQQLPPILKLSRGGSYSTGANLALDSCLKFCKEEGIKNLWTGNGLDMLFGGGVDYHRFKTNNSTEFHHLFWDLSFDLLINRFYKQDGDEINTLSNQYGVNIIMPFEDLSSIICARSIPASMLFKYGEDKYPIRVLAHRYGIPLHLARRKKDPLQNSSGMFDLLREYMYETLPDLIHDAVNFRLTKHYFASNPDTDLQLFLALLANEVN